MPRKKYSDRQIRMFRGLIASGETIAFAADACGLNRNTAARESVAFKAGERPHLTPLVLGEHLPEPEPEPVPEPEPAVASEPAPVAEPVGAGETASAVVTVDVQMSAVVEKLEAQSAVVEAQSAVLQEQARLLSAQGDTLKQHSELLGGIGATLASVLSCLQAGIRLSPASGNGQPVSPNGNGKPPPAQTNGTSQASPSTNGTGTSVPRMPSLNFFEEDDDYEELSDTELDMVEEIAERALAGDSVDMILEHFAEKQLTKDALARITRSIEFSHFREDLRERQSLGLG